MGKKVVDNKVSKTNSLSDIERESNRKINVLRKTNSDIDKNGHCLGYVVDFDASKWSRPKYAKSEQSIKNCNKNIVKNQGAIKAPEVIVQDSKNKCKCLSPSWMKIAKIEMNKKIQRNVEQGKSGNNSTIMKYHKTVDLKSVDEGDSWCGSFVNWVMLEDSTVSDEYIRKTVVSPSKSIRWALFGKKVNKPFYGAIAVKTRSGKSTPSKGRSAIILGKNASKRARIWEKKNKLNNKKDYRSRGKFAHDKYKNLMKGHVGFVLGVDNIKNPEYIYILGANQWGFLNKDSRNKIGWGQYSGNYIKSILYPSRYKINEWNVGFYMPNDYCINNCKLKKYTGNYIIAKGDGD